MLKRTAWIRQFRQREEEGGATDAPPAPQLVYPATPRAVMARVDGVVRACPKPGPKRNSRLLSMAKGKPCLFRWMADCERHGGTTTVACHQNGHEAQKGGARKADDHRSAWGCAACHNAYDQGAHPRWLKEQVFAKAMDRQIKEWQRIAGDDTEAPADRKAARWALEQWGIAT